MQSLSLASFSPPRLAVLVLYAAALLQGLTLVSFPALSGAFKSALHISDAQYGAMFLPQVAFAVLGAMLGSQWARRNGLRRVLLAALLANALSQVALLLSTHIGYLGLLFGTTMLGAGFGLMAAPLNGYPALLFPARRELALVAAHTAMGLGLALGPLLANQLLVHWHWLAFPLGLLLGCVLLLLTALRADLPVQATVDVHAREERRQHPARSELFWVFAAIAVLYAFAEGTFANWAVLYLGESKRFDSTIAASALALFWGALAGGRLLIAALLARIDGFWIWLGLPWAMGLVFLSLPQVATPAGGLLAFAAAGLACSAFFPLTINLASRGHPHDMTWISSMLTAALMLGVGLGSWMVGWLRQQLPLEQLYQLSTAYPVLIILSSLWLRKLKHDAQCVGG